MKPSEIVDHALNGMIPDAEHWTQKQYTSILAVADENGYRKIQQYCMLGALVTVAGGNVSTDTHVLPHDVQEDFEKAREKVASIILEQNPELDFFGPDVFHTTVSVFNDEKSRTYDEVRAVMEKAKCALQEEGQ